ncbi:restriction endonuclease [Campylobacter sp. JMF_01 NE2]|uniref:restriction endonuclease n=1 Tax=unclassified Campylobacter TaxID=2593542 RepID=UPI0022EA01EA|nr:MULTISPECIES: restriction endonuclease [unclassified Campylobacter]MDA3052717.1 restriction endonuclease [Campylobacter sp. JMF_03 NE3]MDA3067048.1 restriction endonuclease [Campylobacter sp. JMF_01 NE2]
MSYWLHRISNGKNVSYPLLEKEGYISIGFSDYSNKDFLQKVLADDGYMRFLDNMEISPELDWIKKYRAKYNLWYFVTNMKKDDIVVVPKDGGEFWICKIEGDALLISDESVNLPNLGDKKIIRENSRIKLENSDDFIDIGYVRKVKILAKLSRAEHADSALTARMKIRQTMAKIDDLADSVENALSRKNANLSEAIEKMAKILHSEILKNLNPDKFENLVKTYFEKIGAIEVVIPSKNRSDKENNDDVDVMAVFDNIKTVINVQAKFHEGQTNDWAVTQIKEYAEIKQIAEDDYFRQYWVVSTADRYSQEAINLAKENKIRLITGIEFAKMIISAGIKI